MNMDSKTWRSWVVGLGCLILLVGIDRVEAAEQYVPSTVKPPAVAREFRGVWVASVKNIDWPSRPGLTTEQQKAELLALLDRAKQLRLNAVLLQVRPSADALYPSRIEPWSEYLTGQMGRAPSPFYDPLALAVEEAHQRGLELHAWFNPYRARHAAAISTVSRDHISKTRPQLVKTYAKSLWLDPGEREVQEHSLNVVLDVVRRYDIDGVHFDDYFYPYPEKDTKGAPLPFPDWSSWKRYHDGGGRLQRDDWRRENVNLFILRVSQSVRAAKPWVRFGISPFGIWRPGFPAQIKGLDAHDALYADSRKWLREGWVDYLAPQLYWGDDKPQTSFTALLGWWLNENPHQRHLWPGLDNSRVGRTRAPGEIVNQVRLTRAQATTDGNLHWGLRALTENRLGLADTLSTTLYAQPALTPTNPWVDHQPPPAPTLTAAISATGDLRIKILPAVGSEPVRFWLLQTRRNNTWTTETHSGGPGQRTLLVPNAPDTLAVTAVDRTGNLSPPVVLAKPWRK